MNKDQIFYLVVEQTTGLVDGYYTNKKSAERAAKYFESEVPQFKCKVVETKFTHELQDCEMINEQHWWINRYDWKTT